jgi:ribonuclease VapC
MLAVDSSAILAMLFEEAAGEACATAIGEAPARLISAVNYVEAGTVLAGRARPTERHLASTDLDAFLTTLRIGIAPVTEDLARAALRARIRYGKGFGTRSGRNFGDCSSYALASSLSAPLLFVGDDFSMIDIEPAIA